MEPLFLTGKRTLLYPQTKRKVEALDNAIFERIQKWRMYTALWELDTEDFWGKKIFYKGVKYTGSPEAVFWTYFQPFFEHEIPKVLAEVEQGCRSKNLNDPEYLIEAADLLKVMVSRLWNEIAKTHQVLKGDGFPKNEDLRDMSDTISAGREKIDEEVAALLLKGEPPYVSVNASVDDVIEIKPNIMGVGVNLNALFRLLQRKWNEKFR